MYCSTCGNPLSPGLSYCNRCGTGTNVKERADSRSPSINAFLTAITIIGVFGLGIMLGGAMALKNEAHFDEPIIAFFMFFSFLLVTTIEVMLIRQLSRFTAEPKQVQAPWQARPSELPPAQPRSLGEPVTSVTENTTRTLEYAHREQTR